VISLRGSLVPVYSPEGPLGQPLQSRTSALIFRLDGRRAGVVVDDVEDALVVTEGDMRELPASEHGDLILGVVQNRGSLIAVMRAASLVAACRDTRVMTTV
jgi:chemotaxis signal transduction protein